MILFASYIGVFFLGFFWRRTWPWAKKQFEEEMQRKDDE